MKTISKTLVVVLAAILFSSCFSTSLVGDWKAPDYSGTGFKKFVVMAMFNDLGMRKIYEEQFVNIFSRDGGVSAISSLSVLQPDKQYAQNELEDIFNKNNVDAIIILNLKDKSTTNNYVPGQVNYVPAGYYNYYFNCYSTFYTTVYTPGYTYQSTTYTVDINLYANSDDKLLWQGETKSIDPASANEMADEIASITLRSMFSNGFVNKTK